MRATIVDSMEERMYGFEIILIVVGLLVIVASFLLTDKGAQITEYTVDESIIEKELDKINSKVDSIIDARKDEIIETTDDKLAGASNEKIMEFKEYTDQVIEKIDKNHQEVVFLYDMLDKKNNELKDSLKKVNDSKSELEKLVEEAKKNAANNTSNVNKAIKKMSENTSKNDDDKELANHLAKDINDIFADEMSKSSDGVETDKKKTVKKAKKTTEVKEKTVNDEESKELISEFEKQSTNERILVLHKQGKSVVEISKLLGMGQGEVKLIINLYKGAKE